MYKKFFFAFLAGLSLQTFVYAGNLSGLDAAKGRVKKLIDSGKSSQAVAIEDQLIADNLQDPCLPGVIACLADSRAELPCHDYGRAKVLYNRLLQSSPRSGHAKRAVLEISKVDIFSKMETGSLDSAAGDVEQLIIKHSKNPYLSEVLSDIAARYTKRYYFKQADALYKRLQKVCPADSFTEKAEFERIKNDVFLKVRQGGEGVDGILSEAVSRYPNHKHLPDVLYFAADKFEENYNYKKAKALYSQTLAINPDDSYSRKSVLDIARLEIYQKIDDCDFNSAQDLTERLIAKYQADSYFPEVLYNVADYYRKCCNNERSRQVYQRLIQDCPQDRYSARAQTEIAVLDIRTKVAMGTFDPAAGDLEQLVNSRGKDYLLARRLYEVGDYCTYAGDYDSAISILGTVCGKFSDFSYYYGRAKIRYDAAKICKDIRDGDLTGAQAAIVRLKKNYAGYYYLSDQLNFVARVYLDYGYPDQSGTLCDEVTGMGEGKYATRCGMLMGCLQVHSRLAADDIAGAKKLVEQFKSKYKDSLYLEEGTVDLACQFSDKGLQDEDDNSKNYLQEAVTICEAQKPADADYRIQSLTILAASYWGLGDFAKSASFYQKIADDYPDSCLVWHAQFMAGRAYQQMLKAGAISEEQADVQIKSAYQKLVTKYPDCQAAKMAAKWLRNHN